MLDKTDVNYLESNSTKLNPEETIVIDDTHDIDAKFKEQINGIKQELAEKINDTTTVYAINIKQIDELTFVEFIEKYEKIKYITVMANGTPVNVLFIKNSQNEVGFRVVKTVYASKSNDGKELILPSKSTNKISVSKYISNLFSRRPKNLMFGGKSRRLRKPRRSRTKSTRYRKH